QYGLTHRSLDVPGKRLDLGVARPPDVEDICAVVSEISADAGPGDHVSHSESTNAIQRAFSIPLERDWLAFGDLLHRDQRHSGKNVGVLSLFAEFLERSHLGDGKPGLSRRAL